MLVYICMCTQKSSHTSTTDSYYQIKNNDGDLNNWKNKLATLDNLQSFHLKVEEYFFHLKNEDQCNYLVTKLVFIKKLD